MGHTININKNVMGAEAKYVFSDNRGQISFILLTFVFYVLRVLKLSFALTLCTHMANI